MKRTDIGPLLGQCNHLSKRLVAHQMQQYEFTSVQAHAMLFLIRNRHREEVTQQELERFLNIRPSTVNGVVARLEEKGFITRVPSKTDRRSKLLLLTEKGAQLQTVFETGIQQYEASLLRGFSPDEQAALRGYLLRIISNLEEDFNLC